MTGGIPPFAHPTMSEGDLQGFYCDFTTGVHLDWASKTIKNPSKIGGGSPWFTMNTWIEPMNRRKIMELWDIYIYI